MKTQDYTDWLHIYHINKEPILKKDLAKKEFADRTGITGYQYMTYPKGDQIKRIYKKI